MRQLIPAAITAIFLLAGGHDSAAGQEPADEVKRAGELLRDSYKFVRPLREGEDPEDLAAQILALDAAAATLGDEGWKVRARCARGFRDIADASPTARDGLERIANDTTVVFREGVAPLGSGDAWVYAMHGLGRLDEVMAWIEQRIDEEPRRSRRFAARSLSMDDAMVAAGRYDLFGEVHGDLKSEALRHITSHTESAKKDAERRTGHARNAFSGFYREEFSTPRRSAVWMLDGVTIRHAALLVDGKDDDAWAVADALLEAQDTSEARASLAMHAVRAGVAGQRHAEWLAQAIERIPQDLRTIERAAVDASMAWPPELDVHNPLGGLEAAIERAEASTDPAIRENAKAQREWLNEMRGDRGEEPPY